jgi:hypothetical protein
MFLQIRHNFNMLKFKNIFWTIFAFVLFLPVNIGFAGDIITKRPASKNELINPLAFDSIKEFLIAATDAFIKIAFPIVVLMIIYSGFLFVAAQGNEEKLKTAKRTIMWTIIGALIVLSATVLVNVIGGTVDKIKSDGNAKSNDLLDAYNRTLFPDDPIKL